MSEEESRDSAKPSSKSKADAANGEAPEPHTEQVEHRTGARQAKENRENDPPA